ncbi:unnamed protein product [Sphagnum balticum]
MPPERCQPSKQTASKKPPWKPLTTEETKLLAQCEEVIRKGLKSFKEVFEALLRARHANRLILAADVVTHLKSDQLVSLEPVAIPDNEAQARPLTVLAPEEQVKAAKIVAKKPGKPTTKDFVEAAREVSRKPAMEIMEEEEEKPRVKAYDPEEDNLENTPVKANSGKVNLDKLLELVDQAQTQARKTPGCREIEKMLGDVAKRITQKMNGGAQFRPCPSCKIWPTPSSSATWVKDRKLRALLIRFLGKEVVEEAAGSQLDIQALENREVTIEVEHIITNRRHEYEYPLVRVSGIQPAKTNPEKGELTAEN